MFTKLQSIVRSFIIPTIVQYSKVCSVQTKPLTRNSGEKSYKKEIYTGGNYYYRELIKTVAGTVLCEMQRDRVNAVTVEMAIPATTFNISRDKFTHLELAPFAVMYSLPYQCCHDLCKFVYVINGNRWQRCACASCASFDLPVFYEWRASSWVQLSHNASYHYWSAKYRATRCKIQWYRGQTMCS